MAVSPIPPPPPTPPPQVVHQRRPRQQQGGGNQPGSQSSSNSNSQSNANSQSGSQAQSGSNSQASSGSNAATSSMISIAITAPVGGVQFTQPPQTAAASFYKIAPSQLITFGWNLTSLSITPSQLTVSAFCSANGNSYPVGPTDGVIPGSATQVVWDPYSYQTAHPQQPLIIASYTLQVMDNHGLTQVPAPGRFAPNTQMTFALYKPQTYTPLASWTCSGCSGASLSVAPPMFFSLIITFFAMLLGGWGVLRRR